MQTRKTDRQTDFIVQSSIQRQIEINNSYQTINTVYKYVYNVKENITIRITRVKWDYFSTQYTYIGRICHKIKNNKKEFYHMKTFKNKRNQ